MTNPPNPRAEAPRRRLQFVWWGWRYIFERPIKLVSFKRLRHEETGLAYVYRWTLLVGPLEIRRWAR